MTFLSGAKILAAPHEDIVSDWASYTPTWGATVAPAIGNGTLTGRYKQVGKWVIVDIGLTAGSTTTFGTGSWTFSLPVNALQPGHPLNEIYVGQWRGWDNSVPAGRQGTAMLASATVIHPHTLADPAANVTATVPITWATSDRCTLRAVYHAA